MAIHNSKGAAQALYRVFVAPALRSSAPPRLPLRERVQRLQVPVPLHSTVRELHSTPIRQSKTRAPEQRQQKWDDEIRARMIILKDPVTGDLSEPRTRYDVLNNLDRTTHRLIQLSADEPDNRQFIPVCRIASKKEEYARQKEYKKKESEKKKERNKIDSVKTLELNWAIDMNDLGHRLERVEGFLAEGRRVEVVLASKKQGRKANRAECEEVLKRIDITVDAVKGAKHLKSLEGKLGGFATLTLQGPAPSSQDKSAGEADGNGE